jgi:hypothetical protein
MEADDDCGLHRASVGHALGERFLSRFFIATPAKAPIRRVSRRNERVPGLHLREGDPVPSTAFPSFCAICAAFCLSNGIVTETFIRERGARLYTRPLAARRSASEIRQRRRFDD